MTGTGTSFTPSWPYWSASYYVDDVAASDLSLGGEFNPGPARRGPSDAGTVSRLHDARGQSVGATNWCGQTGSLLMFPSWLSHAVRPYRGEGVRIYRHKHGRPRPGARLDPGMKMQSLEPVLGALRWQCRATRRLRCAGMGVGAGGCGQYRSRQPAVSARVKLIRRSARRRSGRRCCRYCSARRTGAAFPRTGAIAGGCTVDPAIICLGIEQETPR